MSYSTGIELGRMNRRSKAFLIEEALKRVYLVKWHNIPVPKCLLGKRVMISLVSIRNGGKEKWIRIA